MRYRTLLVTDVPEIARVHRRASLVAYAFMNWSYSELECRIWYQEKAKEWDWGLIAENDRSVVGFVAVTSTHLDQLFVDPRHQHRGIGTHLMLAALARQPAVTILNVFEESMVARQFYEQHGFREARRFLNQQEQATELIYVRDA